MRKLSILWSMSGLKLHTLESHTSHMSDSEMEELFTWRSVVRPHQVNLSQLLWKSPFITYGKIGSQSWMKMPKQIAQKWKGLFKVRWLVVGIKFHSRRLSFKVLSKVLEWLWVSHSLYWWLLPEIQSPPLSQFSTWQSLFWASWPSWSGTVNSSVSLNQSLLWCLSVLLLIMFSIWVLITCIQQVRQEMTKWDKLTEKWESVSSVDV